MKWSFYSAYCIFKIDERYLFWSNHPSVGKIILEGKERWKSTWPCFPLDFLDIYVWFVHACAHQNKNQTSSLLAVSSDVVGYGATACDTPTAFGVEKKTIGFECVPWIPVQTKSTRKAKTDFHTLLVHRWKLPIIKIALFFYVLLFFLIN